MSTKNQHKAQRTCIACRRTRDKKDLIRLVRTKDGTVELDTFGKKPGRGTYLCHERSCWELALLKKKQIEYALKTKLSEEDRSILTEFCNKLLKGSQIG